LGYKKVSTPGSADGLKSVKVPTFDGKRDSFQVWWMRFDAFAKAYKYHATIQEKAKADLPTTEQPDSNDTKTGIAARDRNFYSHVLFGVGIYIPGSHEVPLQRNHG
jgi:hypothetical protein